MPTEIMIAWNEHGTDGEPGSFFAQNPPKKNVIIFVIKFAFLR